MRGTDAKLKRDNVDNEYTANSVHYEVGKEVRNSIKRLGGTMPEDLPTPEKSLKEIEKMTTKAKEDIKKETTQEAILEIRKKYTTEVAKIRTENKKIFLDRIQKINKKIKDTIEKEAKAKGYDIVLDKEVVVYGGQDITTTVLEKLNK